MSKITLRNMEPRTISALCAGILVFQGIALTQQIPARATTPRISWHVRTLVGDDRLMQWKTGTTSAAFPQLTFVEAVNKTDELGLNAIEGSSAQKVSNQIPKQLDPNLTPDEQNSVRETLKSANMRLVGYRAGQLPSDDASQRKVLEFAKGLGADTVIGSAGTASLSSLDKLANDIGIRVALEDHSDPKTALSGLTGISKQIGLAIDPAVWQTNGVKPIQALAQVKERVVAVNLQDGIGAANLTAFLAELNRLGLRPLFLTLSGSDMPSTIEAFERAVQPVLGAFVVAATKSMPIRSGDTLPRDVKEKIDAAIPRTAYVKPKKARKLLVIDACVANMSHNTIPHFNLAIELMAKYTGAFEAVFNNDLDNLRWPKIKQWDAIYLNDTVGELFPDPEIRQSLLRYVREGGGIGGWHGSPWASRSWRELGDMMAAMDAPHRIEPAYIKLDDPKSPINQAFDGTGLQHREEYYRFHYEGPTGGFYSRDKVHVLLSLDTDKSPEIFKPGRDGQPFFTRPDNDYAVAWIRSYGKGRIFYNSMGHMAETMMSKPIMGHVFAGIQFIVGDLDADTTPSAKLAAKK